jgi:hypothetical protein
MPNMLERFLSNLMKKQYMRQVEETTNFKASPTQHYPMLHAQ